MSRAERAKAREQQRLADASESDEDDKPSKDDDDDDDNDNDDNNNDNDNNNDVDNLDTNDHSDNTGNDGEKEPVASSRQGDSEDEGTQVVDMDVSSPPPRSSPSPTDTGRRKTFKRSKPKSLGILEEEEGQEGEEGQGESEAVGMDVGAGQESGGAQGGRRGEEEQEEGTGSRKRRAGDFVDLELSRSARRSKYRKTLVNRTSARAAAPESEVSGRLRSRTGKRRTQRFKPRTRRTQKNSCVRPLPLESQFRSSGKGFPFPSFSKSQSSILVPHPYYQSMYASINVDALKKSSLKSAPAPLSEHIESIFAPSSGLAGSDAKVGDTSTSSANGGDDPSEDPPAPPLPVHFPQDPTPALGGGFALQNCYIVFGPELLRPVTTTSSTTTTTTTSLGTSGQSS